METIEAELLTPLLRPTLILLPLLWRILMDVIRPLEVGVVVLELRAGPALLPCVLLP